MTSSNPTSPSPIENSQTIQITRVESRRGPSPLADSRPQSTPPPEVQTENKSGVEDGALELAKQFMFTMGNLARKCHSRGHLSELYLTTQATWASPEVQGDTSLHRHFKQVLFAIAHGMKLVRVRDQGRFLLWNRYRDNKGNQLEYERTDRHNNRQGGQRARHAAHITEQDYPTAPIPVIQHTKVVPKLDTTPHPLADSLDHQATPPVEVNADKNMSSLNQPITLPTPAPPTATESIWIVRISTRSGAVKARTDYTILKQALYSRGDDWDTLGIWDKDSNNKMKPNSWLGFIVGEVGNEVVELFYIEDDCTIDRPSHWSSIEDYTDQGTNTAPKIRQTLIFRKQDIIRMTWKEWKERTGYKEKYTPRGTTRSKNPY